MLLSSSNVNLKEYFKKRYEQISGINLKRLKHKRSLHFVSLKKNIRKKEVYGNEATSLTGYYTKLSQIVD